MSDTFLFLRLDTVVGKMLEGESTAEGFEDQIELEGFSWQYAIEIQDTKLGTAETLSQGKSQTYPDAGLLTVNKFYDYASADLNDAIKINERFPTGLLTQVTVESSATDEDQAEGLSLVTVFEFEMSNVRVVSCELGTQDAGKSVSLTEKLELSYETFKLRYYPPATYDATGYAIYDITGYNNPSRTGGKRLKAMEFTGTGIKSSEGDA